MASITINQLRERIEHQASRMEEAYRAECEGFKALASGSNPLGCLGFARQLSQAQGACEAWKNAEAMMQSDRAEQAAFVRYATKFSLAQAIRAIPGSNGCTCGYQRASDLDLAQGRLLAWQAIAELVANLEG